VACDAIQALTGSQLTFDVRKHALDNLAAIRQGRLPQKALLQFGEKERIVIRLPADHDAIHMLKDLGNLARACQTAVQYYFEFRQFLF
jgi:hypothetical protein